MIQTDCIINSGNSGGPLFDKYGRVVGITSAKLSNNDGSTDASIEGIGFAIPINDVIDIITDYMQYGYVTGRPYMGILNPQDTDDYAQIFGWPEGVYVNDVEEGSCAETAGIQPGDIITKIDDTDITSVSQLTTVKNSYRAGDTVTVTVYRSGQYVELTLTFDEQTTAQNNTQQDPAPQAGQAVRTGKAVSIITPGTTSSTDFSFLPPVSLDNGNAPPDNSGGAFPVVTTLIGEIPTR